ncbi:CheY-like chemotaxis protein [Flavobacterium sp. 28A]|uniref:response regulator n=1 Tax=Flavobacterium sp. 28A TaxID=2735895 RepID=UPI001570FC19|nr:response regulator [Flavobacterium sp. 28A]NRT14936.1 CheY-like chemotaxis protein [Flavobacterium sp. 28A]
MKERIIWVVDDDIIYKTIMKKIINKSEIFASTVTFCNGLDAINCLKETINNNNDLPDIILLDIEMPIMDGWAFMEELVAIKPTLANAINIYISSSSIAVEDKLRAKNNLDILGYMSKPISLDDLKLIASFD